MSSSQGQGIQQFTRRGPLCHSAKRLRSGEISIGADDFKYFKTPISDNTSKIPVFYFCNARYLQRDHFSAVAPSAPRPGHSRLPGSNEILAPAARAAPALPPQHNAHVHLPPPWPHRRGGGRQRRRPPAGGRLGPRDAADLPGRPAAAASDPPLAACTPPQPFERCGSGARHQNLG